LRDCCHDIGKLLIAVALPRQYDEILALLAVTGGTLIEAERDVIGSITPSYLD